jgi:hypothetical protein
MKLRPTLSKVCTRCGTLSDDFTFKSNFNFKPKMRVATSKVTTIIHRPASSTSSRMNSLF